MAVTSVPGTEEGRYTYARSTRALGIAITSFWIAVLAATPFWVPWPNCLIPAVGFLFFASFCLWSTWKSCETIHITSKGLRVRGIWRNTTIPAKSIRGAVRRREAGQEWVRLDHDHGRYRVAQTLTDYGQFIDQLSQLTNITWHGARPLHLPLSVKSRSEYENAVMALICLAGGAWFLLELPATPAEVIGGSAMLVAGPVLGAHWAIRHLRGGKAFLFTSTFISVPARFGRQTYPAADLHALVLEEHFPRYSKLKRVLLLFTADGKAHMLDESDIRIPLVPIAQFLYHTYKDTLLLQERIEDPEFIPYAEDFRPRETE